MPRISFDVPSRAQPGSSRALLLLRRFAVVVMALVAGAGVASARDGSASLFLAATLAAAPAVAPSDAAPAGHWQESAPPPLADLQVIQSDVDDDDDDALSRDLAEHAAPADHGAPPSRPTDRVSRAELAADNSRFAARAFLPRGPPA